MLRVTVRVTLALTLTAATYGTASAQPERPLPYSVAVASFRSADQARSLAQRLEGLKAPVFVVPVTVNGQEFHRVMAGALPDRESARALGRRLVVEGFKTELNGWDIRPTPLALRFGTTFSEREAAAMLRLLEFEGIPAYRVAASSAGETPVFHLYAGAFQSSARAGPLRDRFARAGFDPLLRTRSGVPPDSR